MTSFGSKRSTKPLSSKLHPILRQWFLARYQKPSEIQALALPHTLQGKNTLILAPTGSGKTLAAFLSVLSKLAATAASGKLPNSVCSVYVSPLKALDNDIHRNLSPALEALNESLSPAQRIRMEVRTGDTANADRAPPEPRSPSPAPHPPPKPSVPSCRKAPGVNTASIRTPSSWMKSTPSLRTSADRFYRSPSNAWSTASSAPCSASASLPPRGPSNPFSSFFAAIAPAPSLKLISAARTAWRSFRLSPASGCHPAGYNSFRIAPSVANLVERAKCTLAFVMTRSGVERLGLALRILLPDLEDLIAVHHGSMDRQSRLDIEEGLKTSHWRAVVASSSLEMGVDFSGVRPGAPRWYRLVVSVPALQRLGRSGHRVDGVASGALVPLSLPDLLESVALREAAREGRLDALRVPTGPLDVLAQALLGMSIEREWTFDEAFQLVTSAGPYRELARRDFDDVLQYLAGRGKVLGPYGTYGKITLSRSFLPGSPVKRPLANITSTSELSVPTMK